MNAAASRAERDVASSAPRMLAECERLLALHLHAAVGRFGAAALGVIDLPPLSDDSVDAAQVRVAAVLLWTREVEAAGLPGFVEALARGVFEGTLLLPITTAGTRLARYHRDRARRLAPEERAALYTRCFGADGDGDFDAAIDDLTERLDRYARARPGDDPTRDAAGITTSARALGALLTRRTSGVAAFAAREITGQIREALDVLRDPDLVAALGHSGVWNILRWHGEAVLGRPLDPAAHIARAQAGQGVLSWVADHARDSGLVIPASDDPALAAASAWRTVWRRPP